MSRLHWGLSTFENFLPPSTVWVSGIRGRPLNLFFVWSCWKLDGGRSKRQEPFGPRGEGRNGSKPPRLVRFVAARSRRRHCRRCQKLCSPTAPFNNSIARARRTAACQAVGFNICAPKLQIQCDIPQATEQESATNYGWGEEYKNVNSLNI